MTEMSTSETDCDRITARRPHGSPGGASQDRMSRASSRHSCTSWATCSIRVIPPGNRSSTRTGWRCLADALPARAHELSARPATRAHVEPDRRDPRGRAHRAPPDRPVPRRSALPRPATSPRPSTRLGDRRHRRRNSAGSADRMPRGRRTPRPRPLVAVLFLQIWGADDELAADELPPRLSAAAARLRSPLLSAVNADDPDRLRRLAGHRTAARDSRFLSRSLRITRRRDGGIERRGRLQGTTARDRAVAHRRTPRGSRGDGASDRGPRSHCGRAGHVLPDDATTLIGQPGRESVVPGPARPRHSGAHRRGGGCAGQESPPAAAHHLPSHGRLTDRGRGLGRSRPTSHLPPCRADRCWNRS